MIEQLRSQGRNPFELFRNLSEKKKKKKIRGGIGLRERALFLPLSRVNSHGRDKPRTLDSAHECGRLDVSDNRDASLAGGEMRHESSSVARDCDPNEKIKPSILEPANADRISSRMQISRCNAGPVTRSIGSSCFSNDHRVANHAIVETDSPDNSPGPRNGKVIDVSEKFYARIE